MIGVAAALIKFNVVMTSIALLHRWSTVCPTTAVVGRDGRPEAEATRHAVYRTFARRKLVGLDFIAQDVHALERAHPVDFRGREA